MPPADVTGQKMQSRHPRVGHARGGGLSVACNNDAPRLIPRLKPQWEKFLVLQLGSCLHDAHRPHFLCYFDILLSSKGSESYSCLSADREEKKKHEDSDCIYRDYAILSQCGRSQIYQITFYPSPYSQYDEESAYCSSKEYFSEC